MTIKEILEKVNRLKPNVISDPNKVEFLNELDGNVYHKIILNSESETTFEPYQNDLNVELLVPSPFTEIYFYFLCAKIDLLIGEINSYNNNMTIYNSYFDDYAAYFRRNNMPKQKVTEWGY